MADDGIDIVGIPVILVMPLEQLVDLGLRPAGQQAAQLLLGFGDALAARTPGEAAGEILLGAVIQVAQQLPLPAVPDRRADGADIGDREAEQQAQAFWALHRLGEVHHRLRIGDVALERRGRHQQVPAHQPGDRFGLGGRQAKTRPELLGHLLAQHRMVAATALGDVVQQHRDIEHAARQHFLDDMHRQRMVFLQRATFDPGQDADGADGMLVHRIGVIHVVLGLCHHAAKIRHEAAEHIRLVQPAQRCLGIIDRAEHVHEQLVGIGIVAQPGIDQLQIAPHQPQSLGVDVEPLLLRQMEQPQHLHRLLLEQRFAADIQAAALDLEPIQLFRPLDLGADRRQRFLLLVALFQRGGENTRQIADFLGDQVVFLHEALDIAAAGAIGIAQRLGDLGLRVEGEPLLRPVGQVMQVDAHGPQEFHCLHETAMLFRMQQAARDQLGGILDAIDVFGDPDQRVQVAQAALAFLHIGLDHITGIAHAAMAVVALGQLLLDEIRPGLGHHVALEPRLQLRRQRLVAPDPALLKNGGADGDVA